MRSTRSFSRARTSERGFALIAALGLAILYFSLIQLILVDSARELAEARRFRAKIVASTIAENAAELAAKGIGDLQAGSANASLNDFQGEGAAELKKAPTGEFVIEAWGETSGLTRARSTVRVIGRVEQGQVRIDYTMHSP